MREKKTYFFFFLLIKSLLKENEILIEKQSKIYLKQNLGDASLTINELKEHLKNGSGDSIMKRMTAYSSNITGSDSYW